ncbi:hypothetical protein CEXT_389761 [Caerostris extrusa]|uniref:Uncharacterized protein n=1 Tax=Caerostris extrusa TaxID=172846 RepID=A0AAV4V9L8_CAEEX|nr:hypothetical protein CEXT_389761 [Caerostris extrusa]
MGSTVGTKSNSLIRVGDNVMAERGEGLSGNEIHRFRFINGVLFLGAGIRLDAIASVELWLHGVPSVDDKLQWGGRPCTNPSMGLQVMEV